MTLSKATLLISTALMLGACVSTEKISEAEARPQCLNQVNRSGAGGQTPDPNRQRDTYRACIFAKTGAAPTQYW